KKKDPAKKKGGPHRELRADSRRRGVCSVELGGSWGSGGRPSVLVTVSPAPEETGPTPPWFTKDWIYNRTTAVSEDVLMGNQRCSPPPLPPILSHQSLLLLLPPPRLSLPLCSVMRC
ncbi:hypothetical protein KUCAC02_012186, partial [Chaenocephalus aceratus]